MKIKSFLVAGLVIFIVCIGIPQIVNASNKQPSKSLYKEKITIGAETWPGYFPLYVAQEKGFFKEAGLDVEIRQYIGLGELSKDYQAGKMQGRANITLDAVTEAQNGFDHRIVMAIDYSNGSDAIVAKKEITSVQDFKGRRVGFEPNTLEEFLLGWALRENGMRLSDVIAVSGNPEETIRQLIAGSLDVAVSHEPFLSQVLGSDDFHKIYSSSDSPGLIMDVLTFRADFIEQYPDTVQAVITVYFKALAFYKTNPGEALAIIAKRFGDTPESIARQLEGVQMLYPRDNKTAFTYAAGLRSIYGNLREVGDFIQSHRDSKPLGFDTDSLVDRRFIKNLSSD